MRIDSLKGRLDKKKKKRWALGNKFAKCMHVTLSLPVGKRFGVRRYSV